MGPGAESMAKLILEGITLYAKDVGRSEAFYRDVVGLPWLGRDDHASHFDAGSVRLSLHPQEGPEATAPTAFIAFGVEGDLEAAYKELSRRGARFEWPPTDKPYGRAAKFRDPDGHELYLWQPPKKGGQGLEATAERYRLIVAKLAR